MINGKLYEVIYVQWIGIGLGEDKGERGYSWMVIVLVLKLIMIKVDV